MANIFFFLLHPIQEDFSIDFGIKFSHIDVMKTAVSVPDEIFKEVEEFSKAHRYSRSKIFAVAVKEFLERRKSRELFDALNQAYSESESSEERTLRTKSKRYYAKRILKGR